MKLKKVNKWRVKMNQMKKGYLLGQLKEWNNKENYAINQLLQDFRDQLIIQKLHDLQKKILIIISIRIYNLF